MPLPNGFRFPLYKICVSGSADISHCGSDACKIAEELGKEIALRNFVLVDGATTGFPFWAVRAAKEAGGIVVGISPAGSQKEHIEKYQVILSANVTHYYYAALALQNAGHLKHYICAIGFRGGKPWFHRLLPEHWQKKLQGRDISGIAANRTRSVWAAELLQRGLPQLGLISLEQGNWLNNYIFDYLARFYVQSCDIFHFVNGIGLFSARKAKSKGCLVVCDVRTEHPEYQEPIVAEEYARLGLPYTPAGRLYERKIKAEYAIADTLIVPSEYAKRTFVQAGFKAHTIWVVPYGVDQRLFSREPDLEHHIQATRGYSERKTNPFRVIYAGQIIPRKGVHYLLEAFSRMKTQNAELLLIGSSEPAMFPVLQKAMRDTPNIHLVGEIPKIELFRYYNSGSVLVLPSLADACGLVVLEAMACGLSVIVTENTGSKEAVQQGVNGFIVPIRDAHAIQEKLIFLYEHRDVLQAMSQAALLSVREFTWDRYGQRLLDAYQGMLGKG